jgi:hypothetical protein
MNDNTDLSFNKFKKDFGVANVLNSYPLLVVSLVNCCVNPNGHSEIE